MPLTITWWRIPGASSLPCLGVAQPSLPQWGNVIISWMSPKVIRHALLAVILSGCVRPEGGPAVRVVRLPAGGDVPSVAVDASGRLHAVYARGNDTWYAVSADGGARWGPPELVSGPGGTADEPGMFRGPTLAIGKNGYVHAVWYPLRRDRPEAEWGPRYSRRDPATEKWGSAVVITPGLAEGLSVAASPYGRVIVGWAGDTGLFIARSTDDGTTFGAPEAVAGTDPVRSCVTRALFLPGGEFLLLYRDRATRARCESVVVWPPTGGTPTVRTLSTKPWPEDACPTTGGWLSAGAGVAVAAWETGDEVSWAFIDSTGTITEPSEVPTAAMAGRWPVAIANAGGYACVSWKESNFLKWQVFEPGGRPTGPPKSAISSGTNGHAGAVLPDGTFVLVDAGK